jgi:hypothetical protein
VQVPTYLREADDSSTLWSGVWSTVSLAQAPRREISGPSELTCCLGTPSAVDEAEP